MARSEPTMPATAPMRKMLPSSRTGGVISTLSSMRISTLSFSTLPSSPAIMIP